MGKLGSKLSQGKILLITEFFSPTIGGSISVYENIYRQYPPNSIYVLTQKLKKIPSSENLNGIEVLRIAFPLYFYSKLQMLLRYVWGMWHAFNLIQKKRLEEIHCDQVLPAGMMAWLLTRIVKIPYFVYAHGEEIAIGSRFPFRRRWMRRIFSDAAGVFANSQFTGSLVEQLGVPVQKIQVIYWGVNPATLNYEKDLVLLKKKYGVSGKKVLLTVSRLIRRKGHYFALKALRELIKEDATLHYLIAGGGEEEVYLKQLVKDFDLKEHVTFLGMVSDESLREIYFLSDLFLMPNIQLENGEVEGFGLVFLEAGAMKKPSIGGESGGTSDAISHEKTGFIVDPYNPQEIKSKVALLLRDPELSKKMGEAASARIRDFFVWDKVFERIERFREKQKGAA